MASGNFSTLLDGALTFSATVMDILGNVAAAPLLGLTKDTVAPLLTVPTDLSVSTDPGLATATIAATDATPSRPTARLRMVSPFRSRSER